MVTMSSLRRLKLYYYLTKPGIVQGNAIAVMTGFLMASRGNIDLLLLVLTTAASSIIIASGCVFNNYIDRDIDSKMARTKKRAIPTQQISVSNALIFAVILLIIGFGLLVLATNWLTVLIGAGGYIFYVFIYAYFKRTTEHGTLIGSVSGAIPPLAGYTAVSNQIDLGAILIFLILVMWQMPHFYAIAMFRAGEYKKAKIPVLSLTRGMKVTKQYIVAYILLYIVVVALPVIFGYLGWLYLIIMLPASLYWLWVAIKSYGLSDEKWARRVFGVSLLHLFILCIAVLADTVLI